MSAGSLQRLRERAPPAWRGRLRRINRFRWLAKRRALHGFGVRVRERPAEALRFILFDPELDNFNYRLDNERELPAFVAGGLGVDLARAGAVMFELSADAAFDAELAAALRRHGRPARVHFGYRLAWYAAARLTAPRLVVETGIHDGLGSAVLLRALERNAEEGSPGELISFDVVPGGGWLVPDSLRARWTPVWEATETALEPALADREVELFLYDGLGTREHELHDLSAVLGHAAEELTVLSARAATGALREVSRTHRLSYREFDERPRHFYPGRAHAIASRRAATTRS
jgi:hypothetical protein